MKKSYTAIACALAMTALPTAQAETAAKQVLVEAKIVEIEANIGVTSNYLWRGVTQTDDGPAISGGIDISHQSGFYAGIWASNINWAVYDLDENGVEVDFYGGYAGENNGLGYDVGLIYYYYPADDYDDSNFAEIYGNLSYGPVEGGIAYTIDTQAGGDDNHLYYWAGASFEVAPTWSIGGTVGHYDFDGGSGSDYTHGQIDVTKSAGDFGDFTFTISKAGENSGDDDPKFVVSWSKSF